MTLLHLNPQQAAAILLLAFLKHQCLRDVYRALGYELKDVATDIERAQFANGDAR